ncbi:hypothetical protein APHDU1_0725 [Anaplasma phagocytophilum]|uniref:Uncharacterized protein n=2 Tax=Anaplasma phagocytophilum TaxID=948 RepID=A0A0F3NN05_ANAPH|nr:hypothetical protein APHWEB_0553 [Anaplasma phagocytophilum str. Webster]KJV64740.1 hypothetical protein APHMUC_1222 [Anaplasma phagocytophilum str. ApMUC09]KJV68279.1 hypothetical protein EPHNCH_0172 [Anaplasma phagocytophilum str. NCH-1]KJV83668.1 hypothetical protein APHHGE2_0191 [Anaplasma phagocytophilum str. HGE2]KJV86450.1 hypothetical protein APHNYW_1507 [Anaplasma phagocytophilum str. ApNYW]KJV99687.1 hypothetical protein OTSANNIE_0139 [Anaplasma phagocytophilum str. Annie]KJZ9993
MIKLDSILEDSRQYGLGDFFAYLLSSSLFVLSWSDICASCCKICILYV